MTRLEARFREKFNRAHTGDVIHIKENQGKCSDKYLLMINSSGGNDIRVVNLNSGVMWRSGGPTKDSCFTEWFTRGGGLSISELDVVHNMQLVINSYRNL